ACSYRPGVRPRASPVVVISHLCCGVGLPRPTRRIFLSSMVRGGSAAPHLSCYSPGDGAWRCPHAPPVVFFSYRWCVVSLSRPTCRIFLSSIVRGDLPAPHL